MYWYMVTAIFILAAIGEWLHARRIRRIRRLAFGPSARPRAWTRLVPLLRVLCLTTMGWALVVLVTLTPKQFKDGEEQVPEQACRRIVFLLDVSPSMLLTDAGQEGRLTRRRRVYELVESILDRAMIDQCLMSVVAFYSGALPVVENCRDPEIIRHIMDDLPLDFAFEHGKTQLTKGIGLGFEMCEDWPGGSTTVILLSDGDTIPDQGMPTPPPSVENFIVLGVGSPVGGIFIDGHQSRQDTRTLAMLARRYGGNYFNGNTLHLPSELMDSLTQGESAGFWESLALRELALLALGIASVLFAAIPVLLEYRGSGWHRQREEES